MTRHSPACLFNTPRSTSSFLHPHYPLTVAPGVYRNLANTRSMLFRGYLPHRRAINANSLWVLIHTLKTCTNWTARMTVELTRFPVLGKIPLPRSAVFYLSREDGSLLMNHEATRVLGYQNARGYPRLYTTRVKGEWVFGWIQRRVCAVDISVLVDWYRSQSHRVSMYI